MASQPDTTLNLIGFQLITSSSIRQSFPPGCGELALFHIQINHHFWLLSFVSYNYRVMTLIKHMSTHFQYMKVSTTIAEDLTRHSLLPTFRGNWVPLHGTDRSQGFELFHSVLDQEKLQVQCSIDSWPLQCLWRCLLQFGGFPPPARPSVRPILGAVLKHSLPQQSS